MIPDSGASTNSTAFPLEFTAKNLVAVNVDGVSVRFIKEIEPLATTPASHTASVEFHTRACPSVVVVELNDTSLRSLIELALKSARPPLPVPATTPASHTASVEFHTRACPSVVVVELNDTSLRSFIVVFSKGYVFKLPILLTCNVGGINSLIY